MRQTCRDCGVAKPLGEFEKQRNRPSHRTTCKPCRYAQRDRIKERKRHREYMRERRLSDPDAIRRNWERARYGVCKEDIGVDACMICQSTRRLCIDHNHSTGEVRGILCTNCNSALGMFGDDIERMSAAIAYLRDGPHFELDRDDYPAEAPR